MPEDLCQIPTPASEDIEIAGVGIPLQALLNLQSQTLHAAPHVGVAGRDPDPDAARYRDHRRLRTSRTRPNASASTFSSTLTRLPPPSSISIRPRRLRDGIAAGASVDETLSLSAMSLRCLEKTRNGCSRSPKKWTPRMASYGSSASVKTG